jgi:ribosome-associated protein
MPLSKRWLIDPTEVEFSAIRAQGAGGQNVNKVSSAAHLRFDIQASSLPLEAREQLLQWPDQRISSDGVIVIKAQVHRSLARNQADALTRLQELVDIALAPVLPRKATKPTRGSQRRRLEVKAQRGLTKAGRKSGLHES